MTVDVDPSSPEYGKIIHRLPLAKGVGEAEYITTITCVSSCVMSVLVLGEDRTVFRMMARGLALAPLSFPLRFPLPSQPVTPSSFHPPAELHHM